MRVILNFVKKSSILFSFCSSTAFLRIVNPVPHLVMPTQDAISSIVITICAGRFPAAALHFAIYLNVLIYSLR